MEVTYAAIKTLKKQSRTSIVSLEKYGRLARMKTAKVQASTMTMVTVTFLIVWNI